LVDCSIFRHLNVERVGCPIEYAVHLRGHECRPQSGFLVQIESNLCRSLEQPANELDVRVHYGLLMQQHPFGRSTRIERGLIAVVDDVSLNDVFVARRHLVHQAVLEGGLHQLSCLLLGLAPAISSLRSPFVISLQPNSGVTPKGLGEMVVAESHQVFADRRIVHLFVEVQMRAVDVPSILVSTGH